MKNKKMTVILLIVVLMALLVGMFFVMFQSMEQAGEETVAEAQVNPEYFSAYTTAEIFQDVPAMKTTEGTIGDAWEAGADSYVVDVDGTTLDEYQAYLKLLESDGFEKYSDNGEDAMEGYVHSATYQRDTLVVTISYVTSVDKTYISATEDLPLSEHLIYKDEYVAGNVEGAQTKIHLVELNNNGTSIVFQLKNGHFVIHDGGQDIDAPYLLDYLESLVPEGEIPVIEGWFISHSHGDHSGAVVAIATNPKWAKRVIVEGFYFTEPSAKAVATFGSQQEVWSVTKINSAFKTSEGKQPELYRPQFGQRYYFSDIAMDITLTSEVFVNDSYLYDDFNETSVWMMCHIEGQRFLCVGDTGSTGMRSAMNIFDKDYFTLDIYEVSHHGINVYDFWVEYCTAKTLLYTTFRTASMYEEGSQHAHVEEHALMQSLAEESVTWGDGTAILTFPYEVGSYEVAEHFTWQYNTTNPGQPKRTVWE